MKRLVILIGLILFGIAFLTADEQPIQTKADQEHVVTDDATTSKATTVKEHDEHDNLLSKAGEVVEDNYGDFDFWGSFVSMLASLFLIILLILIAGWAFKRIMRARVHQGNSSSDIRILEQRSLNPKACVYLLEVRGKGVLVGESSAGLQYLGDVDLGKNQDDENSDSSNYEEKGRLSFGKMLKQKLKREN